MTDASSLIRSVEALDDPVEQRAALASGATDTLFRQVLALTYDPYVRFGQDGHYHRVSPLPKIESDSECNESLREHWEVFSESVCGSPRSFGAHTEFWRSTPAWPILARVLSKHFSGVSFEVANLWGSLPLFRVARVGDAAQPPVPFLTLAEPSHCRAVLVIRRPFSANPSAHWFHPDGDCITDTVQESVIVRAQSLNWIRLELDLSEYQSGIVYDGYLLDVGGFRSLFLASDIVPLAQFKEQKATKPLKARLSDLFLLNAFADESLGCVTYVEATVEGHVEILRDHSVAGYPEAGVLALDPDASYPYHSPFSGRTWLREPS